MAGRSTVLKGGPIGEVRERVGTGGDGRAAELDLELGWQTAPACSEARTLQIPAHAHAHPSSTLPSRHHVQVRVPSYCNIY
jgi:hypothetical protein